MCTTRYICILNPVFVCFGLTLRGDSFLIVHERVESFFGGYKSIKKDLGGVQNFLFCFSGVGMLF